MNCQSRPRRHMQHEQRGCGQLQRQTQFRLKQARFGSYGEGVTSIIAKNGVARNHSKGRKQRRTVVDSEGLRNEESNLMHSTQVRKHRSHFDKAMTFQAGVKTDAHIARESWVPGGGVPWRPRSCGGSVGERTTLHARIVV